SPLCRLPAEQASEQQGQGIRGLAGPAAEQDGTQYGSGERGRGGGRRIPACHARLLTGPRLSCAPRGRFDEMYVECRRKGKRASDERMLSVLGRVAKYWSLRQ